MGASISVPSVQYNKQAVPWTVLGANSLSVSLPITDYNYGVLNIKGRIRTNDAAVNGSVAVTFSGGLGANIAVGILLASDLVLSEASEAAGSSFNLNCEGGGQTAEHFTPFELFILNYASAVYWKEVYGTSYLRTGTVVNTGNVNRWFRGRLASAVQPTAVVLTGTAGTSLVTGSAYMMDYLSKV